METINLVLDYIGRTNLFNFLVMSAIITIIVVKLDVNHKLHVMTTDIADKIEESKEEKSKSEVYLNDMEEVISFVGEEIDCIIKKSEDNAKLIGEKILLEADKTVENLNENSKKIIDNRTMLIKNDILRRVSEASIDVAKNHIINELNGNFDLHHKLIDESVEAINEVNL